MISGAKSLVSKFLGGAKITVIMTVASFSGLITSLANGEPMSLIAQSPPREQKPPQKTVNRPIGSVPSTPRNPDCPVIPGGMPTLTALTPLDDQGVTVSLSQNPAFRFYSPYINGKYRFRLLKSQKSQTALYTQNITGYDKVGIFTVSLPVLPALQPEEYYFWELEYLCSDKPNATNPTVFGRLYRDRLTVAQQLEFNQITNASDRIAFYQKYGIWSELLDEIAKLLPASQVLWQQTLDAEGLQSVSKQPFLFIQPSPNPIKP
jgi:hypothetical protein